MPDIQRTIIVVTEQKVILDRQSGVEGFPLRAWSVEVYLADERNNGAAVAADAFDKVTYRLHPSFGKRATAVRKEAPFRLEEEGWGEFEMSIVCHPRASNQDITIAPHDLHFQQERYEMKYPVSFRNPKPDLALALRDSGNVSDEMVRGAGQSQAPASTAAAAGTGALSQARREDKKRARKESKLQIDMDKLATALTKLSEEELLHVVKVILDTKTTDTYTKNDADSGEFHVDLYTLPDNTVKQLWDYSQRHQ